MNDELHRFPHWLGTLLVLIVLTRFPLLTGGYGADHDAWRIASTAEHLWQTGTYSVSRFPGSPLYELLSAPLVGLGGDLLSNGATLLATLLLIIAWYTVVRTETRNPAHAVFALAFTPLLWKNSAITMDYLWALLFIVLALGSAQRRHSLLAGMMIGVAAGFRLSSIVMIMPIIVVLMVRGGRLRDILTAGAAATICCIIAFSPVLATYGAGAWFQQTRSQLERVAAFQHPSFAQATYRLVYSLGPLAAAWIVFLLFKKRQSILRDFREAHISMVPALIALLIGVLTFLLFPFEREYLLPSLPFLLLVVDRYSSAKQMTVLIFLLISFAAVNPDVVRHGAVRGTFGINVHWGMVVEEGRSRALLLHQRSQILHAEVNQRSIIMTGLPTECWVDVSGVEIDSTVAFRPEHEPFLRKKDSPSTLLTFILTRSEIAWAREHGYTVYYYAGARPLIEWIGKYLPEEEGIHML